jgi:sugar phosphate isomerase/epimerase
MPKLAGFGDEIAGPIAEQIEVMLDEGVRALELRAAEGCGVLDLAGLTRAQVRQKLADAGIEVFSIGSPLGKVPVTDPIQAELDRTQRAIEQAHFFGAPRIRIFSFYIPEGRYAEHRGAVMERLRGMAELAAAAGVLLCHENEAGIYGESVARCADLLATVDSPALRAVHDTANFVNGREEPYPAGYEAVQPWLEYLHIKDFADGKCRAAGEGAGRFPELLARLKSDGWDGYMSLEPHLGGGAEGFRYAARALKGCMAALQWEWT